VTDSTKCTSIAAVITPKSNVAGGGSTSLPNTMAAIILGGPQGLPSGMNRGTRTISNVMKTAPAMTPDQTAAPQSGV
jgi:hypothetical protein